MIAPRNFSWTPIVAGLIFLLGFSAKGRAQQLVQQRRSDGAETPLMVYTPQGSECAPLAVISPGAGGTENGYAYLAEGLRERGWLAVVMGHKESGPGTLRHDVFHSGLHQGLEEMVTDPVSQGARMMDVGAALQWAEGQCHHPYKVLLGHSMGSDTVVFEAGARNKLGVRGEDRFDAYVALSPSGPGPIFPPNAWSDIRKPLYVLTGTRDRGLEGDWKWRTALYEDMPAGCKWLGVIEDATHMNFAGRGLGHRKTERLTLETVDAFLADARSGRCDSPPQPTGMTLAAR
jgi:dienelactone hydrolase